MAGTQLQKKLPAMKIEIKFILEKVSIILQEVSIINNPNADQSARNL